jgi:subtilisin family serine protease
MAAIVALSFFAPASGASAPGQPSTTEINGETDFFVFLRPQADLSRAGAFTTHAERTRYVYETKKAEADQTQAGLRRLLTDREVPFTAYWIANAIKVTGDSALKAELSGRDEVDRIVADRTYPLIKPVRQQPAASTQGAEWNIGHIRAPEAWTAFGARGEGVVVGTIDTGAQFDHPAIARHYRGAAQPGALQHDYSWYDPSVVCGNPSLSPCDNIGHGTHVLGTIVGDDGQGNQTGAAPGADWIAAKGCESEFCSTSALLASGQWMLAPTDLNGSNPRPDLAPNVINNSWGGGPGDPFYQQIVSSWVAAGIFPVFAGGNAGPGCSTAGSPGDYADSYSVGAFDRGNAIATFSSRGPGKFGAEVKPNITAPGVRVRSSVPGNGYAEMDGTSMATPHVTATVALMWSASQVLRGRVTESRELLNTTAIPAQDPACGGEPGDNNVWGHGRLDAFAAVQQSPRGPVGTAAGTVRSGTEPLADSEIRFEGPLSRKTTTNTEGEYQLPSLSVGEYEMTVRKFGYLSQTTKITIVENQTTTRDFDLAVAPRHTLSGHVRDNGGVPVARAAVQLAGTELRATTSDDGAYRIQSVPQGTYNASADRPGCLLPQRQHIDVPGDTTVDFTLRVKSDRIGHVCTTVKPSWVDTDTVLPLTGDEAVTTVRLPFPVNLYGQSYQSAHVSTNGFLSLTPIAWSYPANTTLPSREEPNTAIYAFWSNLLVDSSASVRSGVTGTAPNRSYVVEWRNVTYSGAPHVRLSVQIVLAETGSVTLQYQGIDLADERGTLSTVGIEDETGTDALEHGSFAGTLTDDTAILLRVPGTGLVRGTVTDANDHRPVAKATVTVTQPGAPDQVVSTDNDGVYQARAKVGDVRMRITQTNYATAEAGLKIPGEDVVIEHDAVLRTGRLEPRPASIELVIPPGQSRQRTITLTNSGSADLGWQAKEAGGSAMQQAKPPARLGTPVHAPNARTAKHLAGTDPSAAPASPGQVIRSWPVTGLQWAWGVGYRDGPWISDVDGRRNGHFTDTGTPVRQWPAGWDGAWPADMAAVPSRNAICQVNVGGNNGIYCWNPATGEVTDQIAGVFPWTATSQRGLAYRPDDDTFYIGGWNEGIVYHIKGLSHPDRGAVISQCSPAARSISGLAWNSAFGMLWMATNSDNDAIYGLNPDTCQTIKTIAAPDSSPYTGAGLETDILGNLWTLSQGVSATAYQIDSGVPDFNEVSWLRVSPDNGVLKAGTSSQATVTVDTTGLAPGVYGATIVILSDSGRNPNVTVPVKVVVPAYQTAINTGGTNHFDLNGDTWTPDREYTEGGYGYLDNNRSGVQRTTTPIARTTEQALFQNLRENAFEYRFDNVPDGVYAIDLKFAELKRTKPNTRLFDVISEDRVLIPALDVANEAGTFTAVDRTVYVTVTDGQLNLRLISRKGDPIINAIRVTQRPDRVG